VRLEPHHAAGRTRSWREDEAIAAWAEARARRFEAEPQTPAAPLQGVPRATNSPGPVAEDAQPRRDALSPATGGPR
jgi:predicted nucleic acid-binding Zn ribbon protein